VVRICMGVALSKTVEAQTSTASRILKFQQPLNSKTLGLRGVMVRASDL